MYSKNKENILANSDDNQELRRTHRFRSQKINEIDEEKLELEQKKCNKKKYKVENETRKVNNLIQIRSSKSVLFNIGANLSNKKISHYNQELLPEIIDPSYNFTLNYQLKETAINVFKSGIENDKTKIKFFSNYLYQLSPFNKIFSNFNQSNNIIDMYKLQRILYNLSTDLNYEYYDSNKIIYKHGDIPDRYYILLKGEIDIIVPNEIEVMMNEYEYFYYILRLYKFQELALLKKVLNKNYNIYPLNQDLFEDWIHTGYNTLKHIEKESELTKIIRKNKKKRYIPSYNVEDLFNRLEKQKKLNLLMKSKNVIILLEKIRMRNERLREKDKSKGLKERRKSENKNKKINIDESNFQPVKPSIGYIKIDGILKKVFMSDEKIEIVEKCSKEINQLIEILSEDFNMRKYLYELNRCNSEKYLNRIEPIFFDEDTNEKLDSSLFIISRNQGNSNKYEEKNKKEKEKEKETIDTNDIKIKLKNLFNQNNKDNKEKKKNELFNNRKKTIIYHYVLVNTINSGETFGEISNETIKKGNSNQRIATIITRENSHLASLKRILYNKILKEINENNLHQQLTFLFSLELFKECNKNIFLSNYISFFIKRTFRANDIVFHQNDDLGEDRSIYFIAEGSFFSYCNMSVNDVELLFNDLHYEGLIPKDDAHEDNIFNKENNCFNIFRRKKIIFNLLYFSQNDIIGFNDALCNGKYIYTVKCQTSTATVYEIKLKFFNLILNSEAKLFQNIVKYEIVKRNLMIKLFLNAFNNKNNFYKFISFNDNNNDKEDKNIIHKNYFGKNPFRDINDINKINNNNNKRNKTEFKINNIKNRIEDNYIMLFPKNKRIVSPEIRKCETYRGSLFLNNKNKNKNILNKIAFEGKRKLIFRNKSKNSIKNSISGSSRTNYFSSPRDYTKNKSVYANDSRKKNNKISNNIREFMIKNDLDNNIETDNNDSCELKIEEYQSKSKPKKKIIIPPINTINTHLNDKNKCLYTSLYKDKQYNKGRNSIKLKIFDNTKNELSNHSNNFMEKTKKYFMKSEVKSMNKFKKYLNSIEDNIMLKRNDISTKEEIQLKCYIKDIPDFFLKNNCKKKIFFGMNKKTLFQNNFLFTEYK